MEKYIQLILKKIKEMKIKKIILIVVSVLLIFLFLRVVSKYLENKKFENTVKNTEYNTFEDFKTAREYIVYRGNTYIKEEESDVEGFGLDIYLEFRVQPFEDTQSNQQFYDDMINIIANTQNYKSFRLIDVKNDIIVTVECNQEEKVINRKLINGKENYFSKKQALIEIEDYEYEERTFDIQSSLLKELIEKEWTSSKIKLGEKQGTQERYTLYNKYMVRTISRKIYNIVFNENYSENIINGIKVGTSLEEVQEILGEPDMSFGGIVGYRGEDIYVFFGSNNISVYRTEKEPEENEEFIEILDEFRNNRESKRLVAEITDIWDDYNEYEVNENYINIEYALRGIQIQFNMTEEHGIIVYQNYKGDIEKDTSLLDIKNKENYEIPLYTYIKSNQDLVFEEEISRAVLFGEINTEV